jgi:hypothetical protein
VAEAYPQEVRERAFALYKEMRSWSGVSSILKIPTKTLVKWGKKDKWRDRIEAEERAFARKDPSELALTIQDVAESLGLPAPEQIVYEQLQTISHICLAVIVGEQESLDAYRKAGALLPETFKEALSGLSTCWKVTGDMMSRVNRKEEKPQTGTVDFNAQLMQVNVMSPESVTGGDEGIWTPPKLEE